jgi:hypothetical protein
MVQARKGADVARTGNRLAVLVASALILVAAGCGSDAVVAQRDGGPPKCMPKATNELACSDGVDDDCDGQIDCLDPDCAGQVCGSGNGFQCTAGGCVRPGDLPDLPPVTGVNVTVRGDTALVEFDAMAGAKDYRIYPYPNVSDVLVGEMGELTIRNAIYRCAGDMPLGRREDDVAGGFDFSLGMETATPDVSLANYRRKTADAVLGYVYLTPGADRQAVYRLSDPNETGGFFNADYLPPISDDYNAAEYVVGASERDRLVAAGYRDDGIAFYVADAGTLTVYRKTYFDTWQSGPVVFFTEGSDEANARAGDDPKSVKDFGARLKILATQETGSVPLTRVLYSYAHTFDVLAAGDENFQRVLHQGNRPIRSLAWSGLTGQTTLVIEALDVGCPFPGGYVGYVHADGDIPGGHYPSITMDEGRQPASGELFINGQHDPASRPKPIARSFVDVAPAALPQMDFYESFNPSTAWDQPPEVATDTNNGVHAYRNARWAVDFFGALPNHSLGPILGQFHIGCVDWGSSCGYEIIPRGVTTKLEASRYLHVRMTVDMPSTFRRYPGVVITTTPFKEVDDPSIQHVYDLPVMSRLGPLDAEGTGTESSILVHPLIWDMQLQFCDKRGWGVGDQCKKANTKGRRTHWDNNGQPWLPAPVIGQVAGEDRPVQIDIYASTDRIYLFQDDRPAGCGRLPAGRMPAGPVTVLFHAVGYHLAIDDPANANTSFQYLRNYSLMRTDRHFDDLGISNSVPAPAWDETIFPCGTDWGD